MKGVIFDMDGLMFDTELIFSVAQIELCKKRGKQFTKEIQSKMMGQKPLRAIEIMLQELEIDEEPVSVLNERDEYYEKLLSLQAQAMPGLLELLDFLDAKLIRKAIASSSNRKWINILLERFNMQNRFEVIVSGQDVQHGKPEPDIYLRTVNLLQLPAYQCLVLEDSLNGVIAAKKAGCMVGAVPNMFTNHHDFSEANYIFNSLNNPELLALFR